jgi:hypothetical protein
MGDVANAPTNGLEKKRRARGVPYVSTRPNCEIKLITGP